jgi:flagellar biosynthesis protein FlhF
MRLKSYFSATVEAAMEQARKELGDEALLMNAKPAAPEARYLGAYEVVFGVPPPPPAEITNPPAESEALDRLLRADLAEMRRQIERLTYSIQPAASPAVSHPPASQPAAPTARSLALLEEELSPELVDALCSGTPLDELYTTAPQLGSQGTPRAAVALVGLPGVGKTATLIKLAVRYGLAMHRPVRILCADHVRIAAADQLRALAALLGIPCDAAETGRALSQQLDELNSSKGLTLIDTPGFGFHEAEEALELASAFGSRTDVETQLVLSAGAKMADLRRTVDAFACFGPSKLIFTRIDETAHYGALVNLSWERKLPVSYLCSGQMIPEDLEEATPRRMRELVLGEHASTAAGLRRMGAAA